VEVVEQTDLMKAWEERLRAAQGIKSKIADSIGRRGSREKLAEPKNSGDIVKGEYLERIKSRIADSIVPRVSQGLMTDSAARIMLGDRFDEYSKALDGWDKSIEFARKSNTIPSRGFLEVAKGIDAEAVDSIIRRVISKHFVGFESKVSVRGVVEGEGIRFINESERGLSEDDLVGVMVDEVFESLPGLRGEVEALSAKRLREAEKRRGDEERSIHLRYIVGLLHMVMPDKIYNTYLSEAGANQSCDHSFNSIAEKLIADGDGTDDGVARWAEDVSDHFSDDLARKYEEFITRDIDKPEKGGVFEGVNKALKRMFRRPQKIRGTHCVRSS